MTRFDARQHRRTIVQRSSILLPVLGIAALVIMGLAMAYDHVTTPVSAFPDLCIEVPTS